jgi:hypothetical protein
MLSQGEEYPAVLFGINNQDLFFRFDMIRTDRM